MPPVPSSGEQNTPAVVNNGDQSVNVKKTEIEVQWEKKERDTKHVFQFMKKELDPTVEVGLPEAHPEYKLLRKRARQTTNAMKEDMQGIQAAVDAAKVNIQALFYNSKTKRGGTDTDVKMADGENGGDHAISTGTGDDLLQCHEHLPQVGDNENMNDAKQRDLTLFVAQDTALLLETTRIVKRYTRELAKRRLKET